MIRKTSILRTVSYEAPLCFTAYVGTCEVLCLSQVPDGYHDGGADNYGDEDIVDNGDY